MPVDAFKTRKGHQAVEIPGVGIVDDQDGVPLSRAAVVMHELQDEEGNPLTGRELAKAAGEWADKVGLQVGKAKEPDDDSPETTTPPASAADTKE